MLRSSGRERKLQRFQPEVGDGAEPDRDGHLERRGRRQASADWKRRRDLALEPNGRSPERGELRGYGGAVARPALRRFAQRGAIRRAERDAVELPRREPDPPGRRRVNANAEID